MNRTEKEASRNLAAAYVRMSTEHQQYSTCNQMEVIREYAQRRKLEIVKEYSDEGKSGLNIQGREALTRMISEVQSGSVDFTSILVYDISRWGRFQDADESAYYEFICRQAGVQVHYCAEQFENNGSPISAIIKSVKRAMAGEYSRELSNKVFQGACRLAQMGYKLGGNSGFGVRRMLIDQHGRHKTMLQPGERKNLQTDRVIIVPGPEEEIRVVHWIYQLFIDERRGETEIAKLLNTKGTPTENGRPWTNEKVHDVLTNEKYIGNNVYHRRSCKLKGKSVTNPPEKWVRADGAFQGIVERARFLRAQEIIRWRGRHHTDDELLANLRALLNRRGRLTSDLIDEDEDLPGTTHLIQRFGSLVSVYRLLGYRPRTNYNFLPVKRRMYEKTLALVASLVEKIRTRGASAWWHKRRRKLIVNNEMHVRVLLMRHSITNFGTTRWFIQLRRDLNPDLIIAGRMDPKNEGIQDYYILPGLDAIWRTNTFAPENGVYLDSYRFPSLDFFLGLISRVKLPEAV